MSGRLDQRVDPARRRAEAALPDDLVRPVDPGGMLALQRAAGNQAVGAMLGRQRPSGRMVQRVLIPELRDVLKTSAEAVNGPLTRHEAKNIAGHLDTYDTAQQQQALVRPPPLAAQAEALRAHFNTHSSTTGDATGYATSGLSGDAAELMEETENPTAVRGITALIEHSMDTYEAAYEKATSNGLSAEDAHAEAVGTVNPYARYGALSKTMALEPEKHKKFLMDISEVAAGGEADTHIWVQQAESFLTDFAKDTKGWTAAGVTLTGEDIDDILGMVAVFNLWNTASPASFAKLTVDQFFLDAGEAPEEGEEDEPALREGRPLPRWAQRAMLVRGSQFYARTRANTHDKPKGSRTFLRAITRQFGDFTPHWKRAFANTFYHFKTVGEGPAVWRVYVSVRPEHALKVFRYARGLVGVIDGVNNAKVAGPGEVGMRADTIVIYTETKEARQNVVVLLEEYQREHGSREEFISDLPLGTKHKLPGVSTAQEPGKLAMDAGLRSYGSVFEDAILAAFEVCGPNPTIEAIKEAMLDRCEEVGFDLFHASHFLPDPPEAESDEEEEGDEEEIEDEKGEKREEEDEDEEDE